MEAEDAITAEVSERRGISFSKLKKTTGLANGTIQHHVRNSDSMKKKRGAIVDVEKCRNCPLRSYCSEECVLKVLESEIRRQIVEMKIKGLKNSEIAEELGVHRSTVTYHLSKLPEMDDEFRSALCSTLEL